MVIFMDANEKYKAVISCDGNFDGSFLYGVKSTGIYCRPSCRSKKPSFENTVFFASAEDAENEGFRPCKRCRPDLEKYDAASSAAEQIKNIIDIHFSDTLRLRDEIAKSGFSRGHITRLFEDRYGISVKEYINSVRLSKAKELLENGVSVTDAAFASGYESTAAFSSFFKRQSGISPREYASDFGLRNSFGCLKTPVGLLFISESKAVPLPNPHTPKTAEYILTSQSASSRNIFQKSGAPLICLLTSEEANFKKRSGPPCRKYLTARRAAIRTLQPLWETRKPPAP